MPDSQRSEFNLRSSQIEFSTCGTAYTARSSRQMKSTFRFLRGFVLAFIFSVIAVGASGQDGLEIPVISSLETNRILEHATQVVTVTGKVTRVGKNGNGGITFLNFSSDRGGFVVVMFEADYGNFAHGPEVYLTKKVHVTAGVKPYQGSIPQIQLQTQDQVKVIEEVQAT